jgi:NADH dehydrogenase/NADH:ubiquinone oxidoreductase subunit G
LRNVFFNYINNISLSKRKYLQVETYVGNFVDTETIITAKYLLSRLGSVHYASGKKYNLDFREYYRFNSNNILGVENADIFISVNTHLRMDLPLLNIKIRQNYLKSRALIYMLGFYSNCNYYTKILGLSIDLLVNLLEGLHWICTKLIFSKSPLIIISTSHFMLTDNFVVQFNIYLSKYTKTFYKNWYGLNFLYENIADFPKSELNLLNSIHNQNISFNNHHLCYLIGHDEKYFFKKGKNIVIYQGHYGDISSHFSNIILPSTIFIEKQGIYMNIFGTIQKNKKILFTLGNSRDD